MLTGIKKAHFIGVGGVGMSALARVMLESGCSVSGSDLSGSCYTEKLKSMGADIYIGHSPVNIKAADAVVFSTAIRDDNPELVKARGLGIACLHRSVLLSEIMKSRRSIAVTGTHGKTTTTAMLSSILARSGLEPTVIAGGDSSAPATNGFLGRGRYMVCEADESDGSFLNLRPDYAVITNIEDDHLDHYGKFDNLKAAFAGFAGGVFERGGVAAFSDHPENLRVLGGMNPARSIIFGFGPGCQVSGSGYRETFGSSVFAVSSSGREIGLIQLPLGGLHNAYNALGAVSIALYLGVGFDEIKDALGSFSGVRRRFETMGEVNGVLVIEDYAHHPAELRCALGAAVMSGRRVLAVFQPHRFSRTGMMSKELGEGLSGADSVIITDIYSADERPVEGLTSRVISDSMSAAGHPRAEHIPRKEDVSAEIQKRARPGDIVMILGAGDINSITPAVLKSLESIA